MLTTLQCRRMGKWCPSPQANGEETAQFQRISTNP